MKEFYLLVGLGCGVTFTGTVIALFNYGWTPMPACLLVGSSVIFGMSYASAILEDKL